MCAWREALLFQENRNRRTQSFFCSPPRRWMNRSARDVPEKRHILLGHSEYWRSDYTLLQPRRGACEGLACHV